MNEKGDKCNYKKLRKAVAVIFIVFKGVKIMTQISGN